MERLHQLNLTLEHTPKNMQYTTDLLELWWASLAATMKDRSLAFPISVAIGAVAGIVFWILAAYSARLWNKRYYLKPGLQALCAIAAVLSVLCALTFASSNNIAQAVKSRLSVWSESVVMESEWQDEAFKDAWDEVAKAGIEDGVTLSPSPRTDTSINTLPTNNPGTKNIVAKVYAHAALIQFRKQNPYLATVISPPGEIPSEILTQDILAWFTANPGQSYPAPRGVQVVVRMLEDLSGKQVEPVAAYTRRLSLALFIITQAIVFLLIGWFAHRSNRPAL
jgi:hypothetical protein